jgi:nucleotide-binding universal stress UspA family protein
VSVRRPKISLSILLLIALGLYMLWPWLPFPERAAKPRTIIFYGFSILDEAMNQGIFPAFQKQWKETTGEEVEFVSSFAGSGTVANQLIMGMPAHLALLFLELDAQRLSDAGVIAPQSWRRLPYQGVVNRTPFVILVRPGNPKGIHDYNDLTQPGIGVVHLDPLTSGGGKAVVPGIEPVAEKELWVSLREWRFLQRPGPQVLVFDAGLGAITPLAVARQIAEQMKGSVTILGATRNRDFIETLSATLRERQREAGFSQAELRVRYGNPAGQIAIAQNEVLYDLIILSPRQGRKVARDARPHLMDGIVRKIIRGATVPVLVTTEERGKITRLLIHTSPDEAGKDNVRVGGRLARRLGASVTLLYVAAETEEIAPLARAHLERAESTLRAFDVPVEARIRQHWSIARGILAEARVGGHDIIVIGRREPPPLSLLGIDEITRQVLSESDRPVLLVPGKQE